MSNVLSEEKHQQVIALGRLGWSLRRIERETGVRRETAGSYLRAAGIALRQPGGWGRGESAKPAIEVTTRVGFKTGHRGDHRVGASAVEPTDLDGRCLRALSRFHRVRSIAGP